MNEKAFAQKVRFIIEIAMMIGCIIWLFLMMKPLFAISQYSHSTTDDYWMTLTVHDTWDNTKSLFLTLKEAFRCTVSQYLYHDGNFISMFMLAMSPLVFNESYYGYGAYLALVVLILSTAIISLVIYKKKAKFSWMNAVIITCITVYLFLAYLPSIAEAIYWWPGAANYTVFFAIFLVLHTFCLLYVTERKTKWLVISAIIAPISCQGNLLTALVSTCILFLGWVLLLIIDKKKELRFGIVFGLSLTSLLISVFSPGNFIRGGDDVANSNVFMTVIFSVINGTKLFIRIIKPQMIFYLAIIFIIAFFGFRKSKLNFKFKYTAVVWILGYLLYCASFAPVEYTKIPYYARVLDVLYYHAVTVLIVCTVYTAGYFAQLAQKKADFIEKYENIALPIVAVIFVIFVCNMQFGTTCFAAKVDLENGSAYKFDERIDGRFYAFYDENVRDVVFEEEVSVPSVFFFSDKDTMNEKAYYIENGTRVVADYFYLEDENAVFDELEYINLLTYYFHKNSITMIPGE